MMIFEDKYICHLMNRIKEKDSYTHKHSLRVMVLAGEFARFLGYTTDEIDNVKCTGLLHDIGKLDVKSNLLRKKTTLSSNEVKEINRHSYNGYSRIKGHVQSEDILRGVLEHHERPDGKGYPLGCSGECIHKYARIIAIVDAYDSMTSLRPYTLIVKTKKQAIEEITKCRALQFDEEYADSFCIFMGLESRKNQIGNLFY